MREAQNINFSVNSINQELNGKPVRKYSIKESLNTNFDEVVNFIKSKNSLKNDHYD